MTDAEVLAVIRERVKWCREDCTIAKSVSPQQYVLRLLDALDPDRIDERGTMREELIKDLWRVVPSVGHWPDVRDVADALLAKGWKK